jgi:RNA 3'-terminal phosphate cyclase (ATP)
MIRIDGSYGEGGGQILRSSIALSCITGEEVEISNIRANRPKPGLAPQHLKGIESAKTLTSAEVEGLTLGSTKVVFKPSTPVSKDVEIDIGTAGSVTLILQSVLLPSLLKGCKFKIKGGTDVKWAPTVDYLKNVTIPTLSELGVRCDIKIVRRGYYPKGGGLIEVKAEKSSLHGREFTSKECKIVRGISHCSNLPRDVAERQANSAKELIEKGGFSAEISVSSFRGFSTGSAITLWDTYKGACSIGEKGKRAEVVGTESAKEMLRELNSGACFDKHLADQIMIFSAVAEGRTAYTTSEITMHQKSNAYVIKRFFGDIVRFEGGRIEIDGVGIL